MRELENHWAYKELEKKLETQPLLRPIEEMKELPEFGTLFLVNPRMREEIDHAICDELWPAVLRGIEGSKIGIYEQKKVLTNIRDTRSPELTRELTFLLEDPTRPIGCANKCLWYVRGTLEGRPFTYMLKFDLILEFPMTFDLKMLVRLLGDPRLSGISPTLSVGIAQEVGEDRYVLQFSWGRGGRLGDPNYQPDRLITIAITKHLEIIKAMDELEGDFYAEELFETLSSKIAAFYGD